MSRACRAVTRIAVLLAVFCVIGFAVGDPPKLRPGLDYTSGSSDCRWSLEDLSTAAYGVWGA